jgi:hypothetical protein
MAIAVEVVAMLVVVTALEALTPVRASIHTAVDDRAWIYVRPRIDVHRRRCDMRVRIGVGRPRIDRAPDGHADGNSGMRFRRAHESQRH